jgi:hypothetical protein
MVFRRKSPVLIAVALSLLLAYVLMGTASAKAAGPATVTVRVVGSGNQTLLPLTQVTTNETPVVKNGNPADSCSGTSAAGALELATKGDWDGEWNSSFGYGVETLEGVSYPFTQPDYWAFWRDNKPSPTGVCDTELSSGDSLLFFVECYSETAGVCPSTLPNVLSVEAPTTAEVGKPVVVTVSEYPNAGGEPKPAVGADVVGGDSSAETNTEGHATLTFSSDGTDALRAIGSSQVSPPVPGEALICVHNGNDGTCGTQVSKGASSGSTSTGSAPTVIPYKGEYALVPKLTSLIEGHTYKRGHAPRMLSGTVLAHSNVTSISLELRREYRGRCYAFDGVSTRFVRARCGTSNPFRVSSDGQFSYLLPESLAPGRYVLDIAATDAAGNYTTLARGTSRIVFYVR